MHAACHQFFLFSAYNAYHALKLIYGLDFRLTEIEFKEKLLFFIPA